MNLERPAAVGDRLSGHIVQGHVDGTAEFLALDPLPDGNWWLNVRVPPELDRYADPQRIHHAGRRQPDRRVARSMTSWESPSSRTPTKTP